MGAQLTSCFRPLLQNSDHEIGTIMRGLLGNKRALYHFTVPHRYNSFRTGTRPGISSYHISVRIMRGIFKRFPDQVTPGVIGAMRERIFFAGCNYQRRKKNNKGVNCFHVKSFGSLILDPTTLIFVASSPYFPYCRAHFLILYYYIVSFFTFTFITIYQ